MSDILRYVAYIITQNHLAESSKEFSSCCNVSMLSNLLT